MTKFEEYVEHDLPIEIIESMNESAKLTTKQTNAIFDILNTSSKKSGFAKDDKIKFICAHLKSGSKDQISQIYDIICAAEPASSIALTKTVQDIGKLKLNYYY
jgi:hypothetical protein